MEADVATLKNEVAHLRRDLDEVKAIALFCQKMIWWMTGAGALGGVVLTIVLPKLAEALGI